MRGGDMTDRWYGTAVGINIVNPSSKNQILLNINLHISKRNS